MASRASDSGMRETRSALAFPSVWLGSLPEFRGCAASIAVAALAKIERVGQVRHVAPCPFNNAMAYHVVLAVPQGKVTLLVMPDTSRVARGYAVHDGLHSAVVKVANGSVGIVALDRAVVRSVAGALTA